MPWSEAIPEGLKGLRHNEFSLTHSFQPRLIFSQIKSSMYEILEQHKKHYFAIMVAFHVSGCKDCC